MSSIAAPQSPPPRPSRAPIVWQDPERAQRFTQWFAGLTTRFAHLQLQAATLGLASADASFRRYFRVDAALGSYIIMDAPPNLESCQSFVRTAKLLAQAGVHVPEILEWQPDLGFLLLTDLGSHTLLQAQQDCGLHRGAHPEMAQTYAPFATYYEEAIDTLVRLQLAARAAARSDVLPPYDRALLLRELQLFDTWYIAKHRGITLTQQERGTLALLYERIIERNVQAPQTWVHRDFMPRNLMLLHPLPAAHARSPNAGAARLGVLDFQDAVYGPITYDIASLMRDAFHSWDEEVVLDVTVRYWHKARAAGLLRHTDWARDFAAFYTAVDWMALQRHLKIAGIFARLTYRDGKAHYVQDAPRFIGYIRQIATRYRALHPLLALLNRVENTSAHSLDTVGPLR